MHSNDILKMVSILAVCALIAVGVTGYFGVQKKTIEREADLQVQEVLKEKQVQTEQIQREAQVAEEELRQKQKTERTEERSQFWQKLVPWGNDEAENNENDTDTDEEEEEVQAAPDTSTEPTAGAVR